MKSLPNYHSHTHYCDGKGAPELYVQAALAANMPAYGFSSHCPFPTGSAWNMRMEKLAEYVAEIHELKAKYQGQIELYCGLEMDYIPDIISNNSPHIQDAHLDYTIGSLHFTGNFADGTHCEVDGSHALFMRGVNEIFGGDPRAMVTRYFELTREMLLIAKPDVLGHMDKIKMQDEDGQLFSENEDWYRAEVLKTLDVAASQKVIIEVNTRGIYKKKVATTYPSPWILEEIKKREIPIMLNSDSHHPDEIQAEFPMALQLLKSIGFRQLMVLLEGEWQPIDI